MKLKGNPFPGYENHYMSYMTGEEDELKAAKEAQAKDLFGYILPEGMTMEDKIIAGPDEGQELRIRIFTPANITKPAPMMLEIHGGGWIGGSIDIDNYRCIAFAERVPCIVVCVDYRLSNAEVSYPKPLMDCYTAYMWMHDHAEEIGGDGSRIALHGTSAGGNLCAGLAMYLRDIDGPAPSLCILNCAPLTMDFTEDHSYHQWYELRMDGRSTFAKGAEATYDGKANLGMTLPPKYAFPGHAADVQGLCPHFIVAAEDDTLRDSSIKYGIRLLNAGIPCEMLVAPRVCHGFTTVHNAYTDQVHDLMATSLKREFGLL